MTKNKLKLNVIVSIFSITLIVILLVFTASVFGWFSTNTNVSTTGMNLTVDTPKNIYVSSKDLSQEEHNYIPNNMISTTDYSFDSSCGFTFTEYLYPSSYAGSGDGLTGKFYFARKVLPSGRAKESSAADIEQGKNQFVEVSDSIEGYYYIEKTFYILTTYHERNNIDAIRVYLSNVTFSQGTDTDSNLYKAVRISVSATDKNGTIDEKIYKYDSTTANPASGVNSTISDPALVSGNQASTGANSFVMDLRCVSNDNCYFYPITVKIWIEGQDRNAIASYAGTGFYISFQFKVDQ